MHLFVKFFLHGGVVGCCAGLKEFGNALGIGPAGEDGIEADALIADFEGEGFDEANGGRADAVRKDEFGDGLLDGVGGDGENGSSIGIFQVGQGCTDEAHVSHQ